jgi:transcriptional regulator of arginine metabolism
MSRIHRHSLIKRLVQSQEISSQEELVGLLAEKGVECTQATLSRDLRDLGVVRKNTNTGPVYLLDSTNSYLDALRRVVSMEIIGVRHNGSMLVIRTLAGRAGGVAAYLDQNKKDSILGTVAGDDTVFVAPVDIEKTEELLQQILALGDEREEHSK